MDLLDAATGLNDADLGVLDALCPRCQGRLEIRPVGGQIDVGHCVGGEDTRFELAFSLLCRGLSVERGGRIVLGTQCAGSALVVR